MLINNQLKKRRNALSFWIFICLVLHSQASVSRSPQNFRRIMGNKGSLINHLGSPSRMSLGTLPTNNLPNIKNGVISPATAESKSSPSGADAVGAAALATPTAAVAPPSGHAPLATAASSNSYSAEGYEAPVYEAAASYGSGGSGGGYEGSSSSSYGASSYGSGGGGHGGHSSGGGGYGGSSGGGGYGGSGGGGYGGSSGGGYGGGGYSSGGYSSPVSYTVSTYTSSAPVMQSKEDTLHFLSSLAPSLLLSSLLLPLAAALLTNKTYLGRRRRDADDFESEMGTNDLGVQLTQLGPGAADLLFEKTVAKMVETFESSPDTIQQRKGLVAFVETNGYTDPNNFCLEKLACFSAVTQEAKLEKAVKVLSEAYAANKTVNDRIANGLAEGLGHNCNKFKCLDSKS